MGLHQPGCKCPDCRKDDEFEVFLPDTRKPVRDTKAAPWRYICHVEITRHGRPELGRTGTLIGPRTVLTAAHCIWDESADALENLKRVTIRVYPGRNGKTGRPFPVAKAVRLIAAPGYNASKGASRLDYGIIHLDRPIGNTVGYWSMNHRRWPFDSIGTSILQRNLPLPTGRLKVNISGYPNDKGGLTQWSSYNITKRLQNGMLWYRNDTKPGHSGSPVWVKRHWSMGGRVLVGIHVSASQGGLAANGAVFINDSVRSFLRRHTR